MRWQRRPSGPSNIDRVYFHLQGHQNICHLTPYGASDKELTCQWRRLKRWRFNSCVRKIPWRRAWQPTSLLLPGEPQGQRSLAGYRPWFHKELDMIKWLNNNQPLPQWQVPGTRVQQTTIQQFSIQRRWCALRGVFGCYNVCVCV